MTIPKILFVGNAKSGKSRMFSRLVKNQDIYTYSPTIGKKIGKVNLQNFHFSIWDCAGDPENFKSRLRSYIDANMVFIFHGGKSNKDPLSWELDVRDMTNNSIIIHHVIDPSLKTIQNHILNYYS